MSVVLAAIGAVILIGPRRIFRAAVSRTGDEIVCRYIPWYEGSAYSTTLLLPLTGIAMVDLGFRPGNPAWLWYGGVILLAISALLMGTSIWIWRRSLLRITPSVLTVRIAERGSELTNIRREDVRSIEPKLVPNAAAGTERLQVEIAYQPADVSNETTATVMLGMYLTVQPINLLKPSSPGKTAPTKTRASYWTGSNESFVASQRAARDRVGQPEITCSATEFVIARSLKVEISPPPDSFRFPPSFYR
ncbi:hypothetical protein W7S_23670 [Mycobacterium sp. MOTT36Y]|nr:hypothetical protein W7S_23670 [Mycobacterium sp. MOTT36Y]